MTLYYHGSTKKNVLAPLHMHDAQLLLYYIPEYSSDQ